MREEGEHYDERLGAARGLRVRGCKGSERVREEGEHYYERLGAVGRLRGKDIRERVIEGLGNGRNGVGQRGRSPRKSRRRRRRQGAQE